MTHPFPNEADSGVATQSENKVEVPRLYNVLLHNDDYTTMEFVVLVLTTVFYHTEQRAMEIMLNVHQRGVGIAGTFAYEIAESKCNKVMRLAKAQEYPLKCSLEVA